VAERQSPRRVAGFDPGTARTGYAILDTDGKEFKVVEAGLLETKSTDAPAERLVSLADDIGEVIEKFGPASAGVEELYFSKNVSTGIRVAEARGVILAKLAGREIPVSEYGPGEIKLQLTGYGKAPKAQVAEMACKLTGLKETPKPDDITDAIAVALCHAMRS
jgi:crossover junction endodeoxyribonuclease RuvC